MNGSNGFVINGIDQFDNAGFSVSGSGDVNGDGVDDIIIGARLGDATGFNSGETYVIFGGANVGSSGAFSPASLNGSNGFVITGIGDFHFSGSAVSNAGDVNGDGFDDIIIGATQRSSSRVINRNENSEQSYVVFGGNTVGSSGIVELSNLNGSNGFAINGFDAIDEFDLSFLSVSTAGDINDDGFDDVIIGAPRAAPNGRFSGASYVIFGNANVGSSGTIQLSTLDGTNGFALNGEEEGSLAGISVSDAGDVNADGIDDLIIGAVSGGGFNTRLITDFISFEDVLERSYVLFGNSNLGNTGALELSDLNGDNGYVINGTTNEFDFGITVSGAGDVNGDGVADLIIGARRQISAFDRRDAGTVFILFGGSNVGSNGVINADPGAQNISESIVTISPIQQDLRGAVGSTVSGVGDINGDGVDDFAFSAPFADINGVSNSGTVYVIYGRVGLTAP